MKLQTKSYLISGLLMLSLLAGCAGMAEREATTAKPASASAVMQAYDVPTLMAQAAPAIAQSLENNLPDDVSAEKRQQVRQAILEAFSPDALTQRVRDRVVEAADQAERGAALDQAAEDLQSPLAQRMIELESISSNRSFAEGFRAYMEQPSTPERQARLAETRQLAENMRIIQLQTGFNVTLLEAMIQARNQVVAEGDTVGEDVIQRTVAETRSNIESRLSQRVPQMLLYVFRDVDEETLREYVALQGSPGLSWTNDTLTQAIVDTLDAAGDDIADRYSGAE